jgi:hypothetical protein
MLHNTTTVAAAAAAVEAAADGQWCRSALCALQQQHSDLVSRIQARPWQGCSAGVARAVLATNLVGTCLQASPTTSKVRCPEPQQGNLVPRTKPQALASGNACHQVVAHSTTIAVRRAVHMLTLFLICPSHPLGSPSSLPT